MSSLFGHQHFSFKERERERGGGAGKGICFQLSKIKIRKCLLCFISPRNITLKSDLKNVILERLWLKQEDTKVLVLS